ncbi:MAG: hypothetical protein ABW219_08780 [Ilumatobacteraceae bacterium]
MPGADERDAERETRQQAEGSEFDESDAATSSPFVAYLATVEDLEAAAKKWGDVTWDQSLGIS